MMDIMIIVITLIKKILIMIMIKSMIKRKFIIALIMTIVLSNYDT